MQAAVTVAFRKRCACGRGFGDFETRAWPQLKSRLHIRSVDISLQDIRQCVYILTKMTNDGRSELDP